MISRRTFVEVAGSAALLNFIPRCANAQTLNPNKEVLAFYYPWYGTPAVSGRWRHWQGPAGQAPDQSPLFDHPQLGFYDSNDAEVLKQHALWIKLAGMTGVISSWWGRDSFEDKALPKVLDAMAGQGLKVCAYIEQQNKGPESALDDIAHLLTTSAQHPAWLKVNGRPVLFFYLGAIRGLGAAALHTAATMAADRNNLPRPILIGDFARREASYAENASSFDGMHEYVSAPWFEGMNPKQMSAFAARNYSGWRSKMRGIRCETVMPGFNDTRVPGRKLPRPVVGRFGTGTLDALWRAAINNNPDWVLITSFNEWHEGSEIEPSTEYGDTYLKANAKWAAKFLAVE